MKFVCPKCHSTDNLRAMRKAEASCDVYIMNTSDGGHEVVMGHHSLVTVDRGTFFYYCGKCKQELPIEGDFDNNFSGILEYLAEEPYNNEPSTLESVKSLCALPLRDVAEWIVNTGFLLFFCWTLTWSAAQLVCLVQYPFSWESKVWIGGWFPLICMVMLCLSSLVGFTGNVIRLFASLPKPSKRKGDK